MREIIRDFTFLAIITLAAIILVILLIVLTYQTTHGDFISTIIERERASEQCATQVPLTIYECRYRYDTWKRGY